MVSNLEEMNIRDELNTPIKCTLYDSAKKNISTNKCEAIAHNGTLKITKTDSKGVIKELDNFDYWNLIGVEINAEKKANNQFTIYSADYKNDQHTLRFMKTRNYYSNNEDEAISFKHQLMTNWVYWMKSKHNSGVSAKDLTYVQENLEPWKRRAIVLINPAAGNHTAQKQFQQVEKYLGANGFIMEVILTKKRGEARELVANMSHFSMKETYMFICCGGDGQVHEIINGFYSRQDCNDLSLRFGSLLGGCNSSAAYAQSWAYKLSNKPNQIHALWALTRCHFKRLSICMYNTDGPQKVIFGFHSMGLNCPADVCLNRELLRGNKKSVKGIEFKIQAPGFCSSANKPSTHGYKVSLKTGDPNQLGSNINQGINFEDTNGWKVLAGENCMGLFVNYPVFDHNCEITQRIKLGENQGDFVWCPKSRNIEDNPKWKGNGELAFKQYCTDAGKMNNLAFTGGAGFYNLTKAFKVELAVGQQSMSDIYIEIDREPYVANNLTCQFLPNSNIYQTL